MPVPKRKISKSRSRRRRAANRYGIFQLARCPECGAPNRTHCVCPKCGIYRERPVLSIEVEE